MSKFEQAYMNLVSEVITRGEHRPSRAGFTVGVFGATFQTDCLERGYFPILTQRKIFPAGILGELEAFLKGAEDLQTFKDAGCNYWDANAAEWAPNKDVPVAQQRVGRIYGHTWRNWPQPRSRYQPEPCLQADLPPTFLGVANGHNLSGTTAGIHPLKKTWEGLITRCYNPKAADYPYYGGRGVYVADRWLAFINFVADAVALPGFTPEVLTENSHAWQLDKDSLGDGFCYSPTTCAWLTAEANNPWQEAWVYTVQDATGALHTFTNPHKFCLEHKIESKNFCDLWTGRKNAKTRYGYTLVDRQAVPKKRRTVDQLANLVTSLRTDPYSRRHLLATYNPAELAEGCLPPCHVLAQFNVRTTKQLDCVVTMRSVDLCLGLPSDIILYAALMLVLCSETGYTPGKLTFMLGDTHVYRNHIDQFQEHANRPTHPLPQFTLAAATGIDNFVASNLQLHNYTHSGVLSYAFNK